MRKIASFILVILIIICMSQIVLAVFSCNVNMQIAKLEYEKGEKLEICVNISNIQTDDGIIAFSSTLEYDKDSLILERMEGQNGWSSPSYNEANGKLVMDRNAPTKNDETIMKIIFKVNENSKSDLIVTLKDVKLANGVDSPITINNVIKEIKVKNEGTNIVPEQDNENTTNLNTNIPDKNNTVLNATNNNNNNNNNNNSVNTNNINISNKIDTNNSNINNVTNNNTTENTSNISSTNKTNTSSTNKTSNIVNMNNTSTTANSTLPHTGKSSVILLSIIGIFVVISISSYIKIKDINKN